MQEFYVGDVVRTARTLGRNVETIIGTMNAFESGVVINRKPSQMGRIHKEIYHPCALLYWVRHSDGVDAFYDPGELIQCVQAPSPVPWYFTEIEDDQQGSMESVFRVDANSTLNVEFVACADGMVFGANEANARLFHGAPDLLASLMATDFSRDAPTFLVRLADHLIYNHGEPKDSEFIEELYKRADLMRLAIQKTRYREIR